MSEVDTQSEQADGVSEGDEGDDARYAEMEAQHGEGEAEGEEEAKPARQGLSMEELERRSEQKALALKHERRRRQEMERELAELRAERARPRQEAVQDFTIPNAVDDPIGALEALTSLATNMTAQQRAEAEQEIQRQANAAQTTQIARRMGEYEDDFRTVTPDYDKAVDHFRKDRIADLTEQGYDGPELQRALSTEFIGLVTRSLHAGKDPAEVVYNLAKKRGFGIDKGVSKLQTLQKGQAVSSSLNAGGGKQAEPGRLTVGDVSKLKGKALLDGYAKLRAQERGAR